MKKGKVVSVGLVLAAGLVWLAAQSPTPPTPAEYATDRVNAALSPYDITICDTVEWYRNTNNVAVSTSELQPGDAVVALLDIPYSKMTNEPPTTNKYSVNVVGYVRFNIPNPNNPPSIVSGLGVGNSK